MEVHLTPEQEATLVQLATNKGRDAGELAQEVLGYYLENEARFVEAVKLGEADLERGKYLTHEEVGDLVKRLLHS